VKTGAVILAGGYSSRMNGFKPLMQLGKKSLLEHSVRFFQRGGVDKLVVVTGHRKDEVKAEAARLGVRSIFNKDYDEGMYSSVCAGVKQMKGVKAFFILPVDIPLIRSSTLKTLRGKARSKGVVYPSFDGERGHPPLISSALIPAILKFDGNGGLKALLEKYPGTDIPVWDQGILLDADTPEDFQVLENRLLQMDVGSRAEVMALAELVMKKRGCEHGLMVAETASVIGRELNNKGYRLDLDLLFNSALLHDIAKGEAQHEARGAEMLKKLGLKQLSEIVAAHRDATVPASGKVQEKELVCLADKLVRGTEKMPIEQRFEEKLVLYAKDPQACKAIRKRLANAKGLEKIVVESIGRPLAELLDSKQVAR
jgi:putative nucleotidyltransferase with HDIG domain